MSIYDEVDTAGFAEIFKALSNPHRLKLFLRLATCCGSGSVSCESGKVYECVSELGSDLGIAQSTISHHLKELHRAGLISTRRNGQRIECWVDQAILEKLAGFFRTPVKA